MDLEYVLSVISDGPAKSFAYRRIQYLESRWNLYCLLNEYQELAEMKVSFSIYSLLVHCIRFEHYTDCNGFAIYREYPIGKGFTYYLHLVRLIVTNSRRIQ